jgi:hypothetical protein
MESPTDKVETTQRLSEMLNLPQNTDEDPTDMLSPNTDFILTEIPNAASCEDIEREPVMADPPSIDNPPFTRITVFTDNALLKHVCP